MKKRVVNLGIIVIQIAMFTSLPCSAGVIKDAPEDLLPAAEKILSKEFERGSEYYIKSMDYFKPEDDLMDFSLGEPYPVYGLDVQKVYQLEDRSNFEKALELRVWDIPIYIGDEKYPRTLLYIKKESDGKWHFVGIGGDPQLIHEARENWSAEKGYKHIVLTTGGTFGRLIMLEKDGEYQIYICSQDSVLAKDFGVSRNSEGYFPAISLDRFTRHIKSDERYSKQIIWEYKDENE